MNFLHTFGASVQSMLFAKQQLASMHKLMDHARIPSEKSDDFFQQAILLEKTTGNDDFARNFKRYAAVRRTTVAVASVITVIALILFLLSKFEPTGAAIRAAFTWLMNDFMLFIFTISGIAGVLLLGLIIAYFYGNAALRRLTGPELSRLWQRLAQKWAPQLSGPLGQDAIEPAVIAQYVEAQLDQAKRPEAMSAGSD